jgi:hypothetical protein
MQQHSKALDEAVARQRVDEEADAFLDGDVRLGAFFKPVRERLVCTFLAYRVLASGKVVRERSAKVKIFTAAVSFVATSLLGAICDGALQLARGTGGGADAVRRIGALAAAHDVDAGEVAAAAVAMGVDAAAGLGEQDSAPAAASRSKYRAPTVAELEDLSSLVALRLTRRFEWQLLQLESEDGARELGECAAHRLVLHLDSGGDDSSGLGDAATRLELAVRAKSTKVRLGRLAMRDHGVRLAGGEVWRQDDVFHRCGVAVRDAEGAVLQVREHKDVRDRCGFVSVRDGVEAAAEAAARPKVRHVTDGTREAELRALPCVQWLAGRP